MRNEALVLDLAAVTAHEGKKNTQKQRSSSTWLIQLVPHQYAKLGNMENQEKGVKKLVTVLVEWDLESYEFLPHRQTESCISEVCNFDEALLKKKDTRGAVNKNSGRLIT